MTMKLRKTKIICTLGPASESEEVIRELMLAGMNVARLNFSHGTHEEQRGKLERVRGPGRAGAACCIASGYKGPGDSNRRI